MAQRTLSLKLDSAPFERALASLAELANRSPELVEGFLGGLDAVAEAFRVDRDPLPAGPTGELLIVLEPSDRLLDFLAANGAGNG